MGVSPRRLQGWEPAEFHERLPDGIRVTREPEFSEWDVSLLLAHLANEAEPRNQYGILMSEATDKANWDSYTANKAPRIDFAAQAVGLAQDAYYKQNKDALKHGHLWYPKKRTE